MLLHQTKVITIRFRAETGIMRTAWELSAADRPEAPERALRLFRDSTQSFPLVGLLISFSRAGLPPAAIGALLQEQIRIAAARSASLKIGIALPEQQNPGNGQPNPWLNSLEADFPHLQVLVAASETEAQEWLLKELELAAPR